MRVLSSGHQGLDEHTGGDLAADRPLSVLSQVTEHVAALSKRKAPKLLQQKRAFVRGWHTDTRQLLGGGGGGGGGDGIMAAAFGGTSPGGAVPPTLSASELYAELDARFVRQQRSVTNSELPDAAVTHYANQVAALVGTQLPSSQHERRELVYRWHETFRGQR